MGHISNTRITTSALLSTCRMSYPIFGVTWWLKLFTTLSLLWSLVRRLVRGPQSPLCHQSDPDLPPVLNPMFHRNALPHQSLFTLFIFPILGGNLSIWDVILSVNKTQKENMKVIRNWWSTAKGLWISVNTRPKLYSKGKPRNSSC